MTIEIKALKRPRQAPIGQNTTSIWLDRNDSHRVSLKFWRVRQESKRYITFVGGIEKLEGLAL